VSTQLAYENISATGENAALPHYAPDKAGSSFIDIKTPYLNDSGPQYLGTLLSLCDSQRR
jgi:Xaa-Pro aminopeptidase